jgi:hypothetical protein
VRSSGDAELHSLLDFYKCYRAFVRGKVLGFQLDELGRAAGERERTAEEARAYFDLADAYTRQPVEPTLWVCMGLPASGKTTLAHALAGRLGLLHLSSDVVRKRMAGLRPTVHPVDGFERGLYSRSMSPRTYATLRRHAARWLRRGRSILLDATSPGAAPAAGSTTKLSSVLAARPPAAWAAQTIRTLSEEWQARTITGEQPIHNSARAQPNRALPMSRGFPKRHRRQWSSALSSRGSPSC